MYRSGEAFAILRNTEASKEMAYEAQLKYESGNNWTTVGILTSWLGIGIPIYIVGVVIQLQGNEYCSQALIQFNEREPSQEN